MLDQLPIRAPVPLNQQKVTRGQTRSSGKALGPAAAEGVRANTSFPCSLPEEGRAFFLVWVRGGVSRAGAGGVSPGARPPSGGAEYRAHAQCPAHAPDASEAAVGLFGLFVPFVRNLLQLHMR